MEGGDEEEEEGKKMGRESFGDWRDSESCGYAHTIIISQSVCALKKTIWWFFASGLRTDISPGTPNAKKEKARIIVKDDGLEREEIKIMPSSSIMGRW